MITDFKIKTGLSVEKCVTGLQETQNTFNVTQGNLLEYTGSIKVNSNLNSGSFVCQISSIAETGTWSSGGNMITARRRLAGAGTQNAGLAFGGGNPSNVACTEEYNGTSWSSGGALITSRNELAGAGTQNEGLAFGGFASPAVRACTEEYNGTSWSAGGALATARRYLAGAGTQNEGLAFGGSPSSSGAIGCTEEYNGTSWSSGGTLAVSKYRFAGAGTQNAGLAFGGNTPGISTFKGVTQEYNGTSWSLQDFLITPRCFLGGAGTQNAGLAFGGRLGAPTNANVACTEQYNGTSWSAGGALITARFALAGAGTQNAGLAFGGYVPPASVACTEEYTSGEITTTVGTQINQVNPVFEVNVDTGIVQVNNLQLNPSGSLFSNIFDRPGILFFDSTDQTIKYTFCQPTSAWSTTAGLITGRSCLAGAGTEVSAFAFGGFNPTFSPTPGALQTLDCTEAYNGITWSAINSFPERIRNSAAAGTQNAGLGFGGISNNPAPNCRRCQAYKLNGTSWSSTSNLVGTVCISNLAGLGTQNAALAVGGYGAHNDCTCGILGQVQAFNGSSWCIREPLSVARFNLAAAGTQNAGLAFGGSNPSNVACTEEYNGTSWSAGGNLITARTALAGAGTQNAGLAFGGSPTLSCTEEYNGTSWSSGGALGLGRRYLAGAGTQGQVLAFGGFPGVSSTEIYTRQGINVRRL